MNRHVIQLSVKDFMAVKAVEIKRQGHIIKIKGRNGAGKSSVINALFAAIQGAKALPSKPVRKGATEAVLKVKLEDLTIERVITNNGQKLKVYSGDMEPIRPQEMLNKLFNTVSFDPTEFLGLSKKARRDFLLKLLGSTDEVEKIDENIERLMRKRHDVNSSIDVLQGKLDGMPDVESVPERKDTKALGEELKKVNDELRNVTSELNRSIGSIQVSVARESEQWNEAQEHIKDCKRKIADLEGSVLRKEQISKDLNASIQQKKLELMVLKDELKGLSSDKVDQLQEELTDADEYNRNVDRLTSIVENRSRLDSLRNESKQMTERLTQLQKDKYNLLNNGRLPMKGVEMVGDELSIDGIPFDQMSTSEKITFAVMFGMATNPSLRVLRISDGNRLDDDSLSVLNALAEREDFDIWIEMVSEELSDGFFIEDGELV